MKLYVDLDGVLSDFDRHYNNLFGIKATKQDDNVDWKLVREREGFYYDMPPMPDLPYLWSSIAHLFPVILTGVPDSVPEAPDNKRSWVERHLGKEVEVICCPSKEKYVYCNTGDILIDDWDKYRHLWIDAGGVWITHVSAKDTVEELKRLGVTAR